MNILNIGPEIAKCVLSYAASKTEWYKILLKVLWQYFWPSYSSLLETSQISNLKGRKKACKQRYSL